MHESPSSAQLLRAVIAFLNDVATPALTAHAQFHTRVSANALALVARELQDAPAADARAGQLYGEILDQLGSQRSSLDNDEALLCAAIAEGKIDHTTPKLLSNLREIATAQLAIDQPTYSGLKA